jgi:PHD/YefM family antitoxin component YafN of YafNO toxin-antitoxin module
MEKTVAVAGIESNIQEIIRDVEQNSNNVVVERDGRAVAVVVSLKDYEILKQQRRRRFLELLNEAPENAHLSEDELNEISVELVREFRQSQGQPQ